MEQDKLAALVELIMADPRIKDLLRNGTDVCCDLTLIETKDAFETLPFEWRGSVYCQELPDGGGGFLNRDAAVNGEWGTVRVYQPSLNLIAKLALGIADEPLLKIIQQMLAEGAGNVELLRLSSISRIQQDSYKKLYLLYLEKIRSFGVKVSDDGAGVAEGDFPTAVKTRKAGAEAANAVNWQFKALTERDLLDIGKGSVVTVGRKCIVTSLAVDMARRKSIQICREGEER